MFLWAIASEIILKYEKNLLWIKQSTIYIQESNLIYELTQLHSVTDSKYQKLP